MRQDEEPGAGPERERRARERRQARRRRREERRDTAETVGESCELADSARACGGHGCGGPGRLTGGRGGGGGGDGCSCDGPCDGLSLLSVSGLLLGAAAVVPARGAGGLVRAVLRGYQRWLSRFTPACPATPSCSAYALAAVRAHGARQGLRLAAARVGACGRPARDQPV